MDQVIENIKIITLFTLALFSIFLITYKRGNRRVNLALGLIYAYQALESLNSTFYRFFDFWAFDCPWAFYSTEFTFFLWGPTILYFFKVSLKTDIVFSKKEYWHLAPAIIHTLFLIFKFHMYDNATKTAMLQTGVMSVEEDFVIHFLRNASVVVYIIWSIIVFKKHKKEAGSKKSWLIFFVVIFVIVEIIQVLHFIDLETRIYNTIIYNSTSVIWFSVAITTLFKALKDPYFFVEVEPQKEEEEKEVKKAPEKAILGDEEFQEILQKIQQYVIDKEKYLDPDLTLVVLAKDIETPAKKVSFVVNNNYNQNISDFINSLRINKAKSLLQASQHCHKNIIEIAYEVGFNSKATFNRVFAKFTSMSPSEFRAQYKTS